MSKIFNLPNGGCMYSHDEIKIACATFRSIVIDYDQACAESTNYANENYKIHNLLKRALYKLKSPIGGSELWWNLYREKFNELTLKYNGSGMIKHFASSYCTEKISAIEICNMEMSGRNCYLNPKQIKAISMLLKFNHR